MDTNILRREIVEGWRDMVRNGTMTAKDWDAIPLSAREEVRDKSGLTDQLVGLEGWRVAVLDECGGDVRRFIVGRSTGWRPCHLEIKTKRSMGGDPARRNYYAVTPIERVR